MAEIQESGPLVGQNFTDATWRAIFGGEPAIVGDTIGHAYALHLPPASDSVEVGSAIVESTAVVGGFAHIIPAGTTQSLPIPPSSDGDVGRTDLITLRLDPSTFDTAPGPVRVYRIAGVEGSAAPPDPDDSPPGVEDMPLYAITRRQGEALTQADVVDLRVRSGPHLYAQEGVSPFPSMPLGTTTTRGSTRWSRELDPDTGAPLWVRTSRPQTVLTGLSTLLEPVSPWGRSADCRLVRDGDLRYGYFYLTRSGGVLETLSTAAPSVSQRVAKLHTVDRPASGTAPAATAYVVAENGDWWDAGARLGADGNIRITSITGYTLTRSIVITAVWSVA